jgi:hypothetical protein
MTAPFPQFRKNITGTSYYQITSEIHMIEWQKLGSRILRHELNVSILPERLLIADILACSQGHYEIVSQMDFQLAVNEDPTEYGKLT